MERIVFSPPNPGGMNLYLADAFLASCRLHLAQDQTEEAKSFLTQAKTLIQEMSYHRRDKEVKELEEQLSSTTNEFIRVLLKKIENLQNNCSLLG